MPDGRYEEADNLRHNLGLSLWLASVNQSQHDVVFEPVMNLNVPCVDKGGKVGACVDWPSQYTLDCVEFLRRGDFFSIFGFCFLCRCITLTASNEIAFHCCEAKYKSELFHERRQDQVTCFEEEAAVSEFLRQ